MSVSKPNAVSVDSEKKKTPISAFQRVEDLIKLDRVDRVEAAYRYRFTHRGPATFFEAFDKKIQSMIEKYPGEQTICYLCLRAIKKLSMATATPCCITKLSCHSCTEYLFKRRISSPAFKNHGANVGQCHSCPGGANNVSIDQFDYSVEKISTTSKPVLLYMSNMWDIFVNKKNYSRSNSKSYVNIFKWRLALAALKMGDCFDLTPTLQEKYTKYSKTKKTKTPTTPEIVVDDPKDALNMQYTASASEEDSIAASALQENIPAILNTDTDMDINMFLNGIQSGEYKSPPCEFNTSATEQYNKFQAMALLEPEKDSTTPLFGDDTNENYFGNIFAAASGTMLPLTTDGIQGANVDNPLTTPEPYDMISQLDEYFNHTEEVNRTDAMEAFNDIISTTPEGVREPKDDSMFALNWNIVNEPLDDIPKKTSNPGKVLKIPSSKETAYESPEDLPALPTPHLGDSVLKPIVNVNSRKRSGSSTCPDNVVKKPKVVKVTAVIKDVVLPTPTVTSRRSPSEKTLKSQKMSSVKKHKSGQKVRNVSHATSQKVTKTKVKVTKTPVLITPPKPATTPVNSEDDDIVYVSTTDYPDHEIDMTLSVDALLAEIEKEKAALARLRVESERKIKEAEENAKKMKLFLALNKLRTTKRQIQMETDRKCAQVSALKKEKM